MRIACVATTPLPARAANTIQTVRMAAAFQTAGHDVVVLAPDRVDREPGIDDVHAFYGVPSSLRIEALPWEPSLAGAGFALRAALAARSAGADLIYARYVPAATVAAFAFGIPAIVELHHGGYLPGTRASAWLRLLLRSSRLRHIVTVSGALRDAYRDAWRIPPDRIRTVPNGADELPRSPPRRDADRLVVGYTGHLYPGKGIELVVEIARLCPWAELQIVGGAEADLDRWRAPLDALENVVLSGFVAPSESAEHRRSIDVAIAPYGRRVAVAGGGDDAPYMCPLKVVEYMAAGLPIVATDLPALRALVVDGESALLVPADEPAAWAAALGRLRDDPALRARLGAGALAAFRARHRLAERPGRVLDPAPSRPSASARRPRGVLARGAARASPRPAPEGELPTLIYIAGQSHSGSTLLDSLLGAHGAVLGAGELKQLDAADPARAGLGDTPCPCGAPRKLACPLWRRVDASLAAAGAPRLLELELQAADPERFARDNLAVLRALRAASGRPFIVDSSKDAARLRRLLALPALVVVPVHIVRHGAAVVFSNLRKGRPPLRSSVRHVGGAIALAEALAACPHLEVAYERLAAAPGPVLASVMQHVGLEIEPDQLDWASREQHQIAGNRMRFGSSSSIRVDERWRTEMPLLLRAAATLLTAPSRLPAASLATLGRLVTRLAGGRRTARRPRPASRAAIPASPRSEARGLVDIVIPTFESARWIATAIESALAQGPVVGRVIVVDDGSTDETASVLDRFEGRCVVIRQKNAGTSAARNTGAAAGHAPWLLFLDADDTLLRGAVAALLAEAERSGAGVVHGQSRSVPSGRLRDGDAIVGRPPETARRCFWRALARTPGCVLVRRSAFDAAGGFDPRLRTAEDRDLWMRVAALEPIGAIDRVVIEKRDLPTSNLATSRTSHAAIVLELQLRYPRWCRERGIDPSFLATTPGAVLDRKLDVELRARRLRAVAALLGVAARHRLRTPLSRSLGIVLDPVRSPSSGGWLS